MLAGILYRSSGDSATVSRDSTSSSALQHTQKAIARVAVGKGVRHGFVPHRTNKGQKKVDSSSQASGCQQVSATHITPPVQASLNALTQNFNQSMHETIESTVDMKSEPSAVVSHQDANQYQLSAPGVSSTGTTGRVSYVPGSLHRDDSLVDLAMIPIIGDGTITESNADASSGFSFVDFPFDSNIFSNEDPNI